jgi:uncharacterized protein (TIGR03085 family)
MSHYAVDERHALAETLRSADPKSSTLCGEWTTAALTAHLVLRERSIVEMSGRLPVRRLRGRAEHAIDALVAGTPYEQLVDAVDRGPAWTDVIGPVPVAWLWSLPAVREQVNLIEYLIHHEDVRRATAGTAPRALPVDVQNAVWRRLPNIARLTMRTLPVGVALAWPSHGELRTRRARTDGPAVTVTGDPVELALFAFGRGAVAQVAFDGAPADVATVRGADLGF